MSTTAHKERLIRQRRFWLVLLIAIGLGVLYPLAVILVLGEDSAADAERWILNDPGLVVNLCLLVPASAAILAGSFDFSLVTRVPRLPLLVLLGSLLLAALLVMRYDRGQSTDDEPGRTPSTTLTIEPPPRFRDFRGALALECEARLAMDAFNHKKELLRQAQDRAPQGQSNEVTAALRDVELARKTLRARISDYQSEYGRISGPREVFLGRGSWVARIAFVQNIYAALFIGLFFCSLIVVIVARGSGTSKEPYTWLCFIVATLIFWFPLRLYSEWYRSFGELRILGSEGYRGLVFMIAVGAAAISMLFFILARGKAQRIAVLTVSSFGFFASLAGIVNPDMFGWMRGAMEALGLGFYSLLVVFVLGVPLIAMAYVVVRDIRR